MSSVLSYSHYTISQTKDNPKVSETHWFHTAGTGCFFFSTLACSFSVCIKIHHLNNKRDNDYINIYYKITNHYTTVTTIILPKLCYSLVSITRKFLLFRNNTSCDENSGRSIPHGGHFLIEKDKDTSAFQGTNERLYALGNHPARQESNRFSSLIIAECLIIHPSQSSWEKKSSHSSPGTHFSLGLQEARRVQEFRAETDFQPVCIYLREVLCPYDSTKTTA